MIKLKQATKNISYFEEIISNYEQPMPEKFQKLNKSIAIKNGFRSAFDSLQFILILIAGITLLGLIYRLLNHDSAIWILIAFLTMCLMIFLLQLAIVLITSNLQTVFKNENLRDPFYEMDSECEENLFEEIDLQKYRCIDYLCCRNEVLKNKVNQLLTKHGYLKHIDWFQLCIEDLEYFYSDQYTDYSTTEKKLIIKKLIN